ncbi:MAG: hypothetical protein HY286_19815 [Planctomycetes bacterium]|nr:hypothetical protein [Planctomycetota bacterium]
MSGNTTKRKGRERISDEQGCAKFPGPARGSLLLVSSLLALRVSPYGTRVALAPRY